MCYFCRLIYTNTSSPQSLHHKLQQDKQDYGYLLQGKASPNFHFVHGIEFAIGCFDCTAYQFVWTDDSPLIGSWDHLQQYGCRDHRHIRACAKCELRHDTVLLRLQLFLALGRERQYGIGRRMWELWQSLRWRSHYARRRWLHYLLGLSMGHILSRWGAGLRGTDWRRGHNRRPAEWHHIFCLLCKCYGQHRFH